MFFNNKISVHKTKSRRHGDHKRRRGSPTHDLDRRPLTTPPFEVLKRILLLPRHHPRRPHPPSSSVFVRMMLDTAPPRDFYESKSDDEDADIFQQIDEWISALEEVSDDDLRSWIEVLEERARDGPRDNEEVGWLKAMKDEMVGRNPHGSST